MLEWSRSRAPDDEGDDDNDDCDGGNCDDNYDHDEDVMVVMMIMT